MTILGELIKSINTGDNLEKIQILCSQIFEEEKDNQEYLEKHPKGPNLLLVLEVPGSIQTELGFLGLERESEDAYVIVLYAIKKQEIDHDEPSIKKKRTWIINDSRPEKILTSYAKQYKILIGE